MKKEIFNLFVCAVPCDGTCSDDSVAEENQQKVAKHQLQQ